MLAGDTVRFGDRTIIQSISFDVAPEEFVCLVGPSGCGKTTLLRVAAGLIRPNQGEAVFQGARITEPSPDLAIVFQDYSRALLPWRTVRENAGFGLELAGVMAATAVSVTAGVAVLVAAAGAASGSGDSRRASA